MDILGYKIIDKRVLIESEAAEYHDFPQVQPYYAKRAGDVAFDVRRLQGDGIENMFTYWFRKVGASWKLYAWSDGQRTISATNADRAREPPRVV